jgi:hypothetical protein
MELPMHAGITEASIYVSKSLSSGVPEMQIFSEATRDFEQQSIFRKEQSFVVACILYQRTTEAALKDACRVFFERYKGGELPLINQVECVLLRLTRKIAVLGIYPDMRKQISKELETAPELIRYVRPPTALDRTYAFELELHRRTLQQIRQFTEAQLRSMLTQLLETEEGIEDSFKQARSQLSGWERHLCGFEGYGVGGKHYSFKNMLHNFGIEQRPDLATSSLGVSAVNLN